MPQIIVEITDGGSADKLLAKLREIAGEGVKVETRAGGIRSALAGVGTTGIPAIDGVLGKLKGISPAAIVAAGAVAGIGVAFYALRKAIDSGAKGLEAYAGQAAAAKQIEAVLESTGHAAGLTSEDLQQIATDLQQLTTVGDEVTLSMQAVLLGFTSIKGDEFKRASVAVLDLSERMGLDLVSAARLVGRALEEPEKASGILSRTGAALTAEQERLAKALVIAGDHAGAQAIVLDRLEEKFGGAAAAARNTAEGGMTALDNAVGDLWEKLGEGLSPAVEDLVDRLVDLAESEEAAQAIHDIGAAAGELLALLGPLIDKSGGLVPVLVDLAEAGVDLTRGSVEELNARWERLLELADRLEPALRGLGGAFDVILGPLDEIVGAVDGLDVGKLEVLEQAARMLAWAVPGGRMAEGFGDFVADAARRGAAARERAEAERRASEAEREAARGAAQEAARVAREQEEQARRNARASRELAAEQKRQAAAWDQTAESTARAVVQARYIAEEWERGEEAGRAAERTVALLNAAWEAGVDPLSERGQALIEAKRAELDGADARRVLAHEAKSAAEAEERLNAALDAAANAPPPLPDLDPLVGDLERAGEEIRAMERQWGISTAAMQAIEEQFARDIYSDINSIFSDLLTGQLDSWESFWDAVADAAIQAAARAAAAWATEQVLGGWGSGQSGGFNWASIFGGLFKGGGGATGGSGSVIVAEGFEGGATGVGGSGGAGGASAAVAWGSVAAIVAGIAYGMGWIGSRGSQGVGGVTFGGEDLDVLGTFANRKQNVKPVMDKVRAAIAEIYDFVEQMQLDIEAFGQITVQKRNKTYLISARGLAADVAAGLNAAGMTAEEIEDAIATIAIRTADFGDSVSGFIEAVVRGSEAITQEQLRAEIEMGRMIEGFGRTDLEQRIGLVAAEFDKVFSWIAEQLSGNVEQAMFGFRQTVGEEASRWQDLYYEITGQQRSPQELLAIKQREATLFNAEKALRIAELEARKLELEGQARITEGRLRLQETELRGRAALFEAEQDLAQRHFRAMAAIVGSSAEILEAQLAAINELIAALEAIPPIDIEGLRLPRAGGGNRHERRQSVRDEVAGLEASAMDPFAAQVQGVVGILPALRERIQGLGFSAEEAAELIARARVAVDELGDRLIADVQAGIDDLAPSAGALTDQLAGMDAQAAILEGRLVTLRDAGLLTAEAWAEMQAQLEGNLGASQALAVQSAAEQTLLRAFRFLGMEEEAARLQFELEQAGLLVALAELEVARRRLGLELAIFGELEGLAERLAALEYTPPEAPPPLPPPPPDTGPLDRFDDAADEAARAAEEMARRLERANESLRDFVDRLTTGEIAGAVSPEQAVQHAQAEYERLLALAEAGDVEASEQLRAAAEAYLDALERFSPALLGLRTPEILAQLRALLGLAPLPTAGGGGVGAGVGLDAGAVGAAVGRGNVVDGRSRFGVEPDRQVGGRDQVIDALVGDLAQYQGQSLLHDRRIVEELVLLRRAVGENNASLSRIVNRGAGDSYRATRGRRP